MAPLRSCLLSFLCLLLLQQSLTIRIEDKPRSTESRSLTSSSTSKPTATDYRVSRPEPKQPANRVPPHLQDVRPGYVDDDSGDVIRIIEPPAHFQQLKRLRQRQPQLQPQLQPQVPQTAIVWEQPRKLSTNRVRPKAKPLPKPKLPLSAPQGDLLTQETQFSPQIANNLQLPMEILASVRKTERLLQRQRQKLPHVRQRHVQRQTHTLIAQKSLEQQLYQRGQQQRLRASLTQDHIRSKRVKREAEAGKQAARYDVAQGLKLVAHIGELLNNATRYLPDELEPNELAPKSSPLTSELQICGNATNCDSRRRRQRLFKLQGSKKTAVRGRNFRHEASTKATKAAATITTTTNAKLTTTTTSISTTSATPLASRLVNSRKSPNNRNQRQQLQLPPAPRSDDTVLYADVMSTIRNLRQEHDLEPQFVAPEQLANNTDYRVLSVYLRELEEISKRLPTVAPLTSLNQQEFARATPAPDWYLINNEGKIYGTRLDSETKPTAALFHRFPDLPDHIDPVLTQDLD